MRSHATCDPVAGDRERAYRRQGRVERADRPVLEDHRILLRPPRVMREVNTLVILLLVVIMAAVATYWPMSD